MKFQPLQKMRQKDERTCAGEPAPNLNLLQTSRKKGMKRYIEAQKSILSKYCTIHMITLQQFKVLKELHKY